MLYSRDDGNHRFSATALLLLLVTCAGGCDSGGETDQNVAAPTAVPDSPVAGKTSSPTVDNSLPEELQGFWQPWQGDFDGMVERRVVRALTTYGGYQFYYDEGRPRGATYDMLMEFEAFLNAELGRRNVKVHVLPIPVSRDQLIPNLLAGRGDLIAADLTPTRERQAMIDFARPMLIDVDEVVVQNSENEALASIEDLAGREVFVRRSSSYYEHLSYLAGVFEERQLEPPVLIAADEMLEAEDIIEMISLGEIDLTVMDDYKAELWAGVLPNILVRNELSISSGGSIAWAHRKNSPMLADHLNTFLRRYGRGSLFGNDTYNRHLAQAARARCANSGSTSENIEGLMEVFQKYAEAYSTDWLRLAAQAYQESGLNQNGVSHAGAVGIMQIKPSTAAGKHIGIDDVNSLDANVHAGAKYMRFLSDRYFAGDGDDVDELNQWLLSLAAYNAGPARINRYRKEAEENGYDPNVWFDNVEIVVARRIGRETVSYVSNIFKYFVSYQLIERRVRARNERFSDILASCSDSATTSLLVN